MKKLFTLLTLLVAIVTGAWAADLVDKYTGVKFATTSPAGAGVAELSISGDAAVSSSSIQVGNGKTGTFTIEVKPTGYKIVSVKFHEKSSNKVSSLVSTQGTISDKDADNWYTFTPTGDQTTISISYSGNGGNAQIDQIYTTVTDGKTDDCESLIPSSTSGSVTSGNNIACTSTLATSFATITANGDVSLKGQNGIAVIDFGNGKGITVTATRPIKQILFSWYQRCPQLVDNKPDWNGDSGTYSVDDRTWTADDMQTNIVTFTRSSGSSAQISNIHIIYYPTVVTPEFSLTSNSIGMDETAQIVVGTNEGLDGLTMNDLSYDSEVIEIDANGAITPKAPGSTTITFTTAAVEGKYNAGTASLPITVTAAKADTQLSFGTPTTTVELNGTVENVATLTGGPEGATISYESSDETVATVDANGTVTGKKIGGTATITASYAGNDEYKASEASYEISVVAPALVAVDDYTWNCVDWLTTPGTGDIKTTKWIDNMEAVGTSTNYITIASGGSKSHPDFPSGFNVRVKTNGTSTEDARFFHFIVKPNTKISVYAIRSTNAGGTFALATGSRTNEAAAHTFEADGIEKLEYIYAGADNTDVYVYAKENAISFLAFKVAPYEVIVLDENGGNSDKIEAANGKTINVTVSRTLSPNYYNSLFLPFAMTAEQITAAFGEGAQVATFTGMNSTTQFGFGNVTAMEANVPYLVKPAQEVNGFTVEGVTISNTAAAGVVDGGYSMVGNYDTFTNGGSTGGGSISISFGGSSSSSNEIYYFATTGKIKKLTSTGSIKGLRAFMVKLPAGKTSVETIVSNAGIKFGGAGGGSARARQDFVLYLDEDNTTTGIEAIENGQLTIDNDAPAYNLAGQKVGKGYKGIVIINGKKVVK